MGVTPPQFASPPVLISISQSRCFKTFKYASKRRVGTNPRLCHHPHYRQQHPAMQRAPKPSAGELKILLEMGTTLRRGCARGCSVSVQLHPAKCSALLGPQSNKDTGCCDARSAPSPWVLHTHDECRCRVFSRSAKKLLLDSALLARRLSVKQFGCQTALFKLPVIIPRERIPTWRSGSGPHRGIL